MPKKQTGPPGVLSTADVARIWTEERRKNDPDTGEYSPKTILLYLRESGQTLKNGKPRRYASNPIPPPAGRMGVMPWWRSDQEQELRDWWHSRATQGHGRGGWPAGRRRPRRAAP